MWVNEDDGSKEEGPAATECRIDLPRHSLAMWFQCVLLWIWSVPSKITLHIHYYCIMLVELQEPTFRLVAAPMVSMDFFETVSAANLDLKMASGTDFQLLLVKSVPKLSILHGFPWTRNAKNTKNLCVKTTLQLGSTYVSVQGCIEIKTNSIYLNFLLTESANTIRLIIINIL